MHICFTIHYRTDWGQKLLVSGSEPELGSWDTDKAKELSYLPGNVWSGEAVFAGDGNVSFEYKYILKDDHDKIVWESGPNRAFSTDGESSPAVKGLTHLFVVDSWRHAADKDSVFSTSAFRDVIFKNAGVVDEPSGAASKIKRIGHTTARFRVFAPRLEKNDRIYVIGSCAALGGWEPSKAAAMRPDTYPYWSLEVTDGSLDAGFSYKYIIKDPSRELVMYENGPDRPVPGLSAEETTPATKRLVSTPDDKFRYASKWKGAGIAIPVFSLRSRKGLGTGEFADLKLLADWCASCGSKLIQLLPVSDTSSSMTWMDSSPYSNISVYALHPLYLNLEDIAPLSKKMSGELDDKRRTLNSYDHMNYEEVLAVKRSFLKEIFLLEKEKFLASDAFNDFLEKNAFWLEPYAAFCLLRDKNQTTDFSKWKEYSRPTKQTIDKLVSASSPDYDKVALTYFTQYHLHKQLIDAARYANSLGIVLKGDIPIGINKHSDSCWMNPELFNMDRSAGAPPDPFSDTGQNWGFPTYNWDAMAKDGYKWWKERLSLMSGYFQMVRLDHVLGFFRIWEIPDTMTSGLMGRFNPSIPLDKNELELDGIRDFTRLCDAYIPRWLVKMMFGPDTEEVTSNYLESSGSGRFSLKPGFTTQRDIEKNLSLTADASPAVKEKTERIKAGLSSLVANIILFPDPSKPGFHPRMNMMDTCSFACLDERTREKLMSVYHDYFWTRQNDFWEQEAMKKLPALKSASDMLICGEDLGMVPHCVKPVMEELSLLGMRVQSMPHDGGREFGIPAEYEYLTVCATSTHDMPTMRGWWSEDPARSQRYYNTVLKLPGDAPSECAPEICSKILEQHLAAPSMWAIFPVQDILAAGKDLRRPGPARDERINDPAASDNRWKFRLHVDLEKLIEEKDFNSGIKKMFSLSGRTGAY